MRILLNISEAEKAWYFTNCEAFLLPSIAEGFGLPVAEAMSVGKPVFLNNSTSLPEIGSDKAFYFSDFDSDSMYRTFMEGIEKFRSNKMEQEVIAYSKGFSWENAAKLYWMVYRSLL